MMTFYQYLNHRKIGVWKNLKNLDDLSSCSLKDPDYLESSLVHKISQEELNDLVKDLDFSKRKTEILGSRLQQWILLQKDVKNIIFSIMSKYYVRILYMDGDLVFCNNVGMLMTEVSIEHKTEEWRLFIAP